MELSTTKSLEALVLAKVLQDEEKRLKVSARQMSIKACVPYTSYLSWRNATAEISMINFVTLLGNLNIDARQTFNRMIG